ncbi:histidine biosynthesis trifunctional protein [Cordyceps militaris CM01]|uniref:Histidine biosynthesis trifunctional protein n=1 Tax=Cordyceps militaris (strain CM01) TaxID=983644 RepID=G3JJM7_CORMM|nr:histidine biosynthesis trifunctional protein [Cordyceps militaris CM01]EGX91267.1 histidine biosynthesis trifunctional protein [Cordyceps militaris CM01]
MEIELPLPFLVSVAVPPGLAKLEGLTREEVSILGCPFLDAKPELLEKFAKFFNRHSAEFQAHFDATALEQDHVLGFLDRGAKRVFVTPEALPQYAELGDRVFPVVSTPDLSAASEHGLLVRDFDPKTVDVAKFIADAQATKAKILYIKPAEGVSLEEFIQIANKSNAVPILPSTGLTTDKADTSKLLLSKVLSSQWKSDRSDGLVPTVVTDEAGISLGLAYTSEESILEALRTQTGVYQSRKRGLWIKGATSGDTQELVRIALDCDNDTLKFVVKQKGRFCHLEQFGCFGNLSGIAALERTLVSRKESAPAGSYTARLFSDEKLLRAKIMEEAEELCDAKTQDEVAFEAADLIYFALTKAVSAGVSLADVQANLDAKSLKVKRRPGNAKGKWAEKEGITVPVAAAAPQKPAASAEAPSSDRILMQRVDSASMSEADLRTTLQRPSQKSSDAILKIVVPIVEDVRKGGDKALLSYTHKFEKATSLTSPVLKAPFPAELMKLSPETTHAIDVSYENIRKFHAAQAEDKPLSVETMPGVICGRFSRPIERVGLYVPGGTAVLPSTALMLGVPAMVAGCEKIVLASPPRADGSISPEIVYIAQKVGAESIVLAGGAQAVAAMAYGTESVSKVDKILGPGNQFVTAAKMHVSNDTNAGVSIDMPAGPSEVLVVADKDANPAFVASDLLSQAEHGVDSQVILLTVDLSEAQLKAIEDEVHNQAMALPRVDIVRGAIKHSVTVTVKTIEDAMRISNDYAPEHLILQVNDAAKVVDQVINAGSVFIGEWTPESVGDYSAGVNHSLPTYGYAKQYSGVNLASFLKHITCANLTSDGLRNVGPAVTQLAGVEELHAHKRAVEIRLKWLDEQKHLSK